MLLFTKNKRLTKSFLNDTLNVRSALHYKTGATESKIKTKKLERFNQVISGESNYLYTKMQQHFFLQNPFQKFIFCIKGKECWIRPWKRRGFISRFFLQKFFLAQNNLLEQALIRNWFTSFVNFFRQQK